MFKISFNKNLIRKITEAVLFLLAILMGWYFQWEIANLLFFVLFIGIILHPIPSRFPAFGAIILLVVTAILLIANESSWAETSAIWAYYLMIFTAVLSFSELHEEPESGIIEQVGN